MKKAKEEAEKKMKATVEAQKAKKEEELKKKEAEQLAQLQLEHMSEQQKKDLIQKKLAEKKERDAAAKRKEIEDLKQKLLQAKTGGDTAALAEVMNVFSSYAEKKQSREKRSAALRAELKKDEIVGSGSKVWTLEELQKKPAGLNPNALETYLPDSVFKQIFKMEKAQFKNLPEFKRKKLKAEKGL